MHKNVNIQKCFVTNDYKTVWKRLGDSTITSITLVLSVLKTLYTWGKTGASSYLHNLSSSLLPKIRREILGTRPLPRFWSLDFPSLLDSSLELGALLAGAIGVGWLHRADADPSALPSWSHTDTTREMPCLIAVSHFTLLFVLAV